jgi:hypothetical protein
MVLEAIAVLDAVKAAQLANVARDNRREQPSMLDDICEDAQQEEEEAQPQQGPDYLQRLQAKMHEDEDRQHAETTVAVFDLDRLAGLMASPKLSEPQRAMAAAAHAQTFDAHQEKLERQIRKREQDQAMFQAAKDKVDKQDREKAAKAAALRKPDPFAQAGPSRTQAERLHEQVTTNKTPHAILSKKAVENWRVTGESMTCKLDVSDIHGGKVLPGSYTAQQAEAVQTPQAIQATHALCQMLCLPQGQIHTQAEAQAALIKCQQEQVLTSCASKAQQVKDDEALAKSLTEANAKEKEQVEGDGKLAEWTAQTDPINQEAMAQQIGALAPAPSSPGSGKQPWREVVAGKKKKGHKGQ